MKSTLLSLLAVGLLSSITQANDTQDPLAAHRAAVKEFGQTLQGELKSAMKAGGPVNGIGVCNLKAPAIAADISKKHGWQVSRTSLKPRNPDNAPDAWETKVLQDFEQRKAAGEDPAKLEYSEKIVSNGKEELRYMKAIVIPADAPCLACHGSKIAPEVSDKVKALYPKDQATGYKTGDIRGAFSIRQPM